MDKEKIRLINKYDLYKNICKALGIKSKTFEKWQEINNKTRGN